MSQERGFKMKRLATVTIIILIVAGLSLAFTNVEAAEKEKVIHWKAQSSWIRGPGHQQWAEFFAQKVNELAKGRLVIDKMYASGEIVGGFEVIPAVSQGKLDLGHSSGYYLLGTRPYNALIQGSGATRLKYSDEHLMWMYYGGGLELYQKYNQEKYNVMLFPTGSVQCEVLWTTKPIRKKEDFKGLKIRSSGLGIDFYNRLGANAVNLPMSEVIPSLERGVLDGAEFCVPYTDYPAHIHEVCPYALAGQLHQPTLVSMEAWINLDSWNALPDDLKDTVREAANLTVLWSLLYLPHINMGFLEKMKKEGTTFIQASPEMQAWFFEVGDQMARDYTKKDPWAKKILESQQAYHEKYMKYGTCFPWLGNNLVPGACGSR